MNENLRQAISTAIEQFRLDDSIDKRCIIATLLNVAQSYTESAEQDAYCLRDEGERIAETTALDITHSSIIEAIDTLNQTQV